MKITIKGGEVEISVENSDAAKDVSIEDSVKNAEYLAELGSLKAINNELHLKLEDLIGANLELVNRNNEQQIEMASLIKENREPAKPKYQIVKIISIDSNRLPPFRVKYPDGKAIYVSEDAFVNKVNPLVLNEMYQIKPGYHIDEKPLAPFWVTMKVINGDNRRPESQNFEATDIQGNRWKLWYSDFCHEHPGFELDDKYLVKGGMGEQIISTGAWASER